MTAAIPHARLSARPSPSAILDAAARFWFAVAVAGQALFLIYIVGFYVPSTLTGRFEAWNLNTMLIKGYVPGDTAGNLAFGTHVLMAAVITFGGTLQLVPQIRARVPAVHRWIGRAFMVTAIGASLGGLGMVWIRGTTTNMANALGITLDAVLILAFATFAWRAAVTRDFADHRRWALRLFMVANGVWFLRVGVVAWGMLGAASGLKPDMGAFFDVWNFGSYLVPLAILELYLLAKARGGGVARTTVAGVLVVATLLMGAGGLGAWLGIFAPVLAKL